MPGAMKFLTWADLSEAQLKEVYFLRDPKPDAAKTCREALARTLALEGAVGDASREVLLDLYVAVLAKCQAMQLSYEKTSTFFSIMKVTHGRAVGERLPVDRSFTACKELLLQHSVQRPPYSVAVFTLEELKELSEWALENYYRYYKMYQYVYTPRIKVSITSRHPTDIVERAPLLPSLDEAETSEQHEAKLVEEAAAEEARQAAQAEADAAAAEDARKQKIQDEYLAAIPDEIKVVVAKALEPQLGSLKVEMGAVFKAQEEELLEKIQTLEAKLGKN